MHMILMEKDNLDRNQLIIPLNYIKGFWKTVSLK